MINWQKNPWFVLKKKQWKKVRNCANKFLKAATIQVLSSVTAIVSITL